MIMMKTALAFLWALSVNAAPVLDVYTYDSFDGPGTLGELLRKESVKATGCETRYQLFATAGEALNQLALEKKNTKADIVIGVDQVLFERANEVAAFVPLGFAVDAAVDPDLIIDPHRRWLPYDYGYLSIVYDTKRKNPPREGMRLSEFAADPKFRKRLVFEDPRTSSLGQSLLAWTLTLYPVSQFEKFWKNFIKQSVAITPGWTAAYGMFESAEADFVVSYTTSPAYHIERKNQHNIKAMLFPEGHYRQIESVGVIDGAAQKDCAIKWVNHLLSVSVQQRLPLLQWMYPVRRNVTLPASFKTLPKVERSLELPVGTRVDTKLIETWTNLAAGLK